MSENNKEKSKQLGIDFGTASNRLKKKMIFELAKKCELTICFRCNEPIESDKDLTFDHKVEWLHSENPVEIFFDLANIAFSHSACNYKARRLPTIVRGKSGYKGVYKDKKRGDYRAMLSYVVDGKRKCKDNGRYKNPLDAAKAYDILATEVLGDRAQTNKKLGLLNAYDVGGLGRMPTQVF